jgi:pimeloyl-ACP methyl ester carboxylesterase
MKRKIKINKVFRFIVVLFLVFSFSFSPMSYSGNLGFSVADVVEDISGTETWTINEDIEESLVIKPGATLTIKSGVTVTFKNHARLIVRGNLYVEGTAKDPVYFKKSDSSSGYSVNIMEGGKAIVKNADISGGGMYYDVFVKSPFPFVNIAHASNYEAAFLAKGGLLEISDSKIHDNKMGVGIHQSGDPKKVRVKFCSFLNNDTNSYNESRLSDYADYTYNWWGDSSGPPKECRMIGTEKYCEYTKDYGRITFEPWLEKEKFQDPVILIPGILGSWKLTDGGSWKLDPIFKTYDSLFETFEENGYQEGKDLFAFPYQWRASNVETAKLLKEKIEEIKQISNWPRVDIVAHSMGGLVAREYVESPDYQNDIDRLVMLGTPNRGAPQDYLMWEGGEFGNGKSDSSSFFMEKIFKQEAKKAGFESIHEYLHKMPIKSVEELLPDYNYLYDIASDKMRLYANNEHYPRNIFLDNLNSSENLERLKKVSLTNIVSELEENSTIEKIKVGKPSIDETSLWAHGKPSEDGLVLGKGDGTVPIFSSKNVPSGQEILVKHPHSQLPGKTKDIVYEAITGYLPQKNIPFIHSDKVLIVLVFSPIDIQIISPDGKWAGKNIQNLTTGEIEGSFYSGHDTENEFLTVPNPENGEYQIITEGTDDGEFKIEIAKISENENGEALEISNEISGVAREGTTETKKIELQEDKILTEEEKVPTIETLILDVQKFYSSGLITKKATKIYLEIKLKNIEKVMNHLEVVKQSHIPQKAKQNVIKNLERLINLQIDHLTHNLKNQKSLQKTIDENARESLLGDLEKVKATF